MNTDRIAAASSLTSCAHHWILLALALALPSAAAADDTTTARAHDHSAITALPRPKKVVTCIRVDRAGPAAPRHVTAPAPAPAHHDPRPQEHDMHSHFIIVDTVPDEHGDQPDYFGPYPTFAIAERTAAQQAHHDRLRVIALDRLPKPDRCRVNNFDGPGV